MVDDYKILLMIVRMFLKNFNNFFIIDQYNVPMKVKINYNSIPRFLPFELFSITLINCSLFSKSHALILSSTCTFNVFGRWPKCAWVAFTFSVAILWFFRLVSHSIVVSVKNFLLRHLGFLWITILNNSASIIRANMIFFD